ncbi:MAG: AbrB/MazE/SpoVT family DNA-binding domain-containing protein [Bdellovibrionota bacterium]
MSVKLSSKYQVVIPEEVRAALNLTPGMQIDVIAKGSIAYLVPVRSLSSVREKVASYLNKSDRATLRDKKDRKV